jgi:hypothetical protein
MLVLRRVPLLACPAVLRILPRRFRLGFRQRNRNSAIEQGSVVEWLKARVLKTDQ